MNYHIDNECLPNIFTHLEAKNQDEYCTNKEFVDNIDKNVEFLN